jgi:hypothetical protein
MSAERQTSECAVFITLLASGSRIISLPIYKRTLSIPTNNDAAGRDLIYTREIITLLTLRGVRGANEIKLQKIQRSNTGEMLCRGSPLTRRTIGMAE